MPKGLQWLVGIAAVCVICITGYLVLMQVIIPVYEARERDLLREAEDSNRMLLLELSVKKQDKINEPGQTRRAICMYGEEPSQRPDEERQKLGARFLAGENLTCKQHGIDFAACARDGVLADSTKADFFYRTSNDYEKREQEERCKQVQLDVAKCERGETPETNPGYILNYPQAERLFYSMYCARIAADAKSGRHFYDRIDVH